MNSEQEAELDRQAVQLRIKISKTMCCLSIRTNGITISKLIYNVLPCLFKFYEKFFRYWMCFPFLELFTGYHS